MTRRTALLRFLAERIVENALREEEACDIDQPTQTEKNTRTKEKAEQIQDGN
jgi:hypothetical protein